MHDKKTIIFLNLRFSDFYSKELFKRIKEKNQYRLIAIIDQQFKDKIGAHIATYLDKIIYLPSYSKNGFLAEFYYDDLRYVIEDEIKISENIKIVCSDEFNLLNAGKLRREMHISGHTDQNLLPYRNKEKMKQLLLKGGVRVPKFKLFNQSDSFEDLANEIGLPFVIKPVDSCGSHGVYIIRHEDEFNQLKTIMNWNFESLEVEEFIEGKLYHVDVCIRENKIKFICANEYTCPNYQYTKGHALGSIPLDENDSLSIRLIDFAKKCLTILKTNNMVNHIELFHTQNDEIVFLEVSGRPPGALLNLTHHINFGFNLMDEDFFMQSDINMKMKYLRSEQNAFFVLFPLIPGKIVKLNHPKVQSQVDIKWHVEVGDVIDSKDCNNIVAKSASAIFYHSDIKILRADFEFIKKHKAIEVI